MAVIETWFKQDLNTAVKPRSFPGEVFNNDSLGNLIGVEVTKDGQAVSLTGSVNGYCILADGETIPVAGTRSGNKASIILPHTAYSVRGIIKISIKITDGQATTTLLQVVGAVDQSVTGNMVNPGSVVQDWSQQIAAAMQELHDLENNYVRVDTASQGLTETKKSNGRTNIDAANVADVNNLKSAFESVALVETPVSTTWVIGSLNTKGVNIANTTRVKNTLFVVSENEKVTVDPTAQVRICYYTLENVYDHWNSDDWLNGELNLEFGYKARILGRYTANPDADIPSADPFNTLIQIHVGTYKDIPVVDATLSITGDAAEAKTVGDAINHAEAERQHIMMGFPVADMAFGSGALNNNGSIISGNTRIINNVATSPTVFAGDYIYVDETYAARYAIYEPSAFNRNTFIAFSEDFANGYILVDEQYVGKKLMLLIRKVGYENDDISADVPAIPNYIKYYSLGAFASKKSLVGKRVAIIGDSISTHGNTGVWPNAPEILIDEADVGVQLTSYISRADTRNKLTINGHTYTDAEAGTEVTFTPAVADVGKRVCRAETYNDNTLDVWWKIMADVLGFTPIPAAWSGASVSSHQGYYGNPDNLLYYCSYAWHPSIIRRCGVRTPGTMERTPPDVIIIYRGTNDMTHEPYTRLTDGYFDGANWQYPTTDEISDGVFGYKEALCLTIQKLREAYPLAQIFLCTLNTFKRLNCSHFPTNNGLNTLPEYNKAIREVADYMGCKLIEFDKDGITFENCYSGGYITDSETNPTHPNAKGHRVMAAKAIVDFLAQYNEL